MQDKVRGFLILIESKIMIAQAIATQKTINFESAWMFVHRFLSDLNFQIDDSFWQRHDNMIFNFLRETHGLKNGDNIQVNVDYTTLNDNFLILCAFINVAGEKDTMLYFTARNYPKRKNQMDQKKMELALFKGLRHLLSKNIHTKFWPTGGLQTPAYYKF
jgi:hypothetical protein